MKKNYTINIPIIKLWLIILPLLVLTLCSGGIIGVIIVDRVVMPNLPNMNDRGVVNVPEIVGLEKSIARQKLYDIGLRLDVQDKEYSDLIDAGVVITQQPLKDEKVKKGRHILVIISKGSEVDTLPSVKEMKENQARRTLSRAGFSKITVFRRFSNKIEKDFVSRIEPGAGIITSREIPVKLFISKGSKPTHATVPSMIGNQLSEAREKLEDEGLNIGQISYKISSDAMVGAVISQSVTPGESIPLESRINLVVGSK